MSFGKKSEWIWIFKKKLAEKNKKNCFKLGQHKEKFSPTDKWDLFTLDMFTGEKFTNFFKVQQTNRLTLCLQPPAEISSFTGFKTLI